MAVWYVYRREGQHWGPLTTESVAEMILLGKLEPDVWVAAPGGGRWLRALDVPVIAALIDSVPTRRRASDAPPRRDSGLRMVPGTYTSTPEGPNFGSTVMMVDEHELLEMERMPPTVAAEELPDAPPTEPNAFEPFSTDPHAYGMTEAGGKRGPDGFPLPPSSSSPKVGERERPDPGPVYRGGETLESEGVKRKTKSA